MNIFGFVENAPARLMEAMLRKKIGNRSLYCSLKC